MEKPTFVRPGDWLIKSWFYHPFSYSVLLFILIAYLDSGFSSGWRIVCRESSSSEIEISISNKIKTSPKLDHQSVNATKWPKLFIVHSIQLQKIASFLLHFLSWPLPRRPSTDGSLVKHVIPPRHGFIQAPFRRGNPPSFQFPTPKKRSNHLFISGTIRNRDVFSFYFHICDTSKDNCGVKSVKMTALW